MNQILPSAQPEVLPAGFDPAGFVGTLRADGQTMRVSALACTDAGQLALISLIGYETSVDAAMGRLIKCERLHFSPADPAWNGPTELTISRASYWMWRAALTGTREHQGVLIVRYASIQHGLQHPPAPPALSAEEVKRQQELRAENPLALIDETLRQMRSGKNLPESQPPRIVLADPVALAPTPAAFFGHLRGLRVVCLPSVAWVDYLWQTGCYDGLIVPLHSAGIRAWWLDGHPERWNALISEGVRLGCLPTASPTDDDHLRLHLRAA
ncbi:MAG TPA: hypothetical protein VFS21_40340 [Roseiflexaceae bacterium]|nr:hypothetical protein [Roseiflexaceae bacterium]